MNQKVENLYNAIDAFRESPLSTLSSKEIDFLVSVLLKAKEQAEKNSIEQEISRFMTRVPWEQKPLWDRMIKLRKIKKGNTVVEKQCYLSELKNVEKMFHSEIDKYQKLIKSLLTLPEEKSLEKLISLDKEEKERLALVANLSRFNSSGKSIAYRIPSSRGALSGWLSELKSSKDKNIVTLEDR